VLGPDWAVLTAGGPVPARRRGASGSPVGGLVPQPSIAGGGRLDDVLGPDWAVLTAGGPVPAGWPGRVVQVADLGSPDLERWLGGRSVLVRPDRIVAARA
jgi:3-(3-hydroxy-phenyl)propionate hydroxylase